MSNIQSKLFILLLTYNNFYSFQKTGETPQKGHTLHILNKQKITLSHFFFAGLHMASKSIKFPPGIQEMDICCQNTLKLFPVWCAKWHGTRGLDVFASKSMVQEIITCAFSSGLGTFCQRRLQFFPIWCSKWPGT